MAQRIASKFNVLMVVTVLVSVLIPSLVVAGYLLHRYSEDVIEKDRLHIKGLASSVQGFLDHAFTINYQLSINPTISNAVRAAPTDWPTRKAEYAQTFNVTRPPDASSGGRASGLPLLASNQRIYRFVDLFFVLDAAGDQVARSFGDIGRRGQRWWFKQISNDPQHRPFFSKSYYSMTGNKPVATAFHPIVSDGRFIGVMGTQINFDRLQTMVTNYLQSEDLFAIILDNEGVIIAHPDKSKADQLYNLKELTRQELVKTPEGKPIQDPTGYHKSHARPIGWTARVADIVRSALMGNQGAETDVVIDGNRSTVYYEPVRVPGAKDLYYVTLLIRNNATIARAQIAICAFVVAFASVLTGLLLTVFRWQFHRRVMSPIKQLTVAMRQSSPTDTHQLLLATGDEFQTLAEASNQMRQQLVAANQRLNELNEELEEKIDSRTRELEHANINLRMDIARRKSMETALRESEQLYRRTMEASPDSITITRARDGKIIKANDGFCQQSGYTREEALGKTVFELNLFVHPERRERIVEQLRRTGAVNNLELQFRTKSGEIRDSLYSARRLQMGDENCIIAVVADITSRKLVENEVRRLNKDLEERVLERTRQLEIANRNLGRSIAQAHRLARAAESSSVAKSAFLANMSHEIRTPMNGIIGMCELVMGTELTPRQKEYMSIVQSSAKSLLDLLNDILDFSKIEAGKLSFEQIEFLLRGEIEKIGDLFIEELSEKQIEMVIDVAPDVPAKLVSDPLRLRQVLLNLISNAIKFTQTGELEITVKLLNQSESNIELLFCVRDTGIGVDPKLQDRLFDVFTQADDSTTRKYGGTGLGLAICRRIVQMMDGKIWVESEVNVGSRFYFTAWFKPSQDQAADIGPKGPDWLADIRPIIVEDNRTTRAVLIRHLENLGMRPEAFETAEAAIEAISADKTPLFHLVLMDIGLPGMNGLDAIDAIRRRMGNNAPRFIIISASGKKSSLKMAQDAGVTHYLLKPVKSDALLRAILDLFSSDGKRVQSITRPMDSDDDFEGIRILVVEDNPVNQRVAFELLSSVGMVVDIAQNGRDGVSIVRQRRYDAVLMDIQMPEMDGLEACALIRRELSPAQLPIIAMTACATPQDRDRCLAAGMNGYLAKPIHHSDLMAMLRDTMTAPLGAVDTASPNISENQTNWAVYPGIDPATGIKRLGGSPELYGTILAEYCDAHGHFWDELNALLKKSDFKRAHIRAHSLKGAAGNVAADHLFTLAGELESACRNADARKARHCLDRIRSALATVMASARQFNNDLRTSKIDQLDTADVHPPN